MGLVNTVVPLERAGGRDGAVGARDPGEEPDRAALPQGGVQRRHRRPGRHPAARRRRHAALLPDRGGEGGHGTPSSRSASRTSPSSRASRDGRDTDATAAAAAAAARAVRPAAALAAGGAARHAAGGGGAGAGRHRRRPGRLGGAATSAPAPLRGRAPRRAADPDRDQLRQRLLRLPARAPTPHERLGPTRVTQSGLHHAAHGATRRSASPSPRRAGRRSTWCWWAAGRSSPSASPRIICAARLHRRARGRSATTGSATSSSSSSSASSPSAARYYLQTGTVSGLALLAVGAGRRCW